MALSPSDFEAIRNLYGRYCVAIDTGDLDAVLECFAPDAVITYDGLPAETGRNRPHRGLEEIGELTAGVYRGTQGHVFHVQHIQTIEGDGDEARVSVYAEVLRRGQTPRAGTILTETAEDVVTRIDGKWVYSRREGRMDSHDSQPVSADPLVIARDNYVDAGLPASANE